MSFPTITSLAIHLVALVSARHQIGHQVAEFFRIQHIDQARWHLRNRQLLYLIHITDRNLDRFCRVIRRVDRYVVAILDIKTAVLAAIFQRDLKHTVLVRDVLARIDDRLKHVAGIELVRNTGDVRTDVAAQTVEPVAGATAGAEKQTATALEVGLFKIQMLRRRLQRVDQPRAFDGLDFKIRNRVKILSRDICQRRAL